MKNYFFSKGVNLSGRRWSLDILVQKGRGHELGVFASLGVTAGTGIV